MIKYYIHSILVPSAPPSDLYATVVTRMLPTDIRVFFNYPEEGKGANGKILGGRLYWMKVENEKLLPPIAGISCFLLTNFKVLYLIEQV